MNKITITSTGSTKSTYKENNQSPKHTTIKWDGEYDGKVKHQKFDPSN